MNKHTTHFDDCGCLSETYKTRIEALESALKEIIELSGPPKMSETLGTIRHRLGQIRGVVNLVMGGKDG